MSDVAGTWECTVHTPMGAQKSTLTINVDGDTLTGTNATAMGTLELEQGKVDGNNASWTMKMTAPMPMTLEATVTADGDSMTGGVKAGMFGTSKLEATRAA
jgi:hypothetical protein